MILAIGIILPVVLFQSLRYGVGTDYFNYQQHFLNIGSGKLASLNEFSTEPLFLLEVKTLYSVFGNPFSMFLVHSLLMNILLFFALKDEKSDMVASYIVFYLTIFPVFLNIERQGLAVILVWCALKSASKRDLKRFIVLMLIAIGYHSSAVVFAPFYLLTSIQNKKIGKYIRGIIYVLLVASPVYFEFLFKAIINSSSALSEYSKYMDDSGDSGSMKMLFIIGLLLFEVFVIKFMRKSRTDYHFYIILGLLSCVFCLMNIYIRAGIGTRMLYYSQYGVVYLAGAICGETRSATNRFMYRSFFLAASLFYFWFVFYHGNAGDIFPYKLIHIN